MKRIHLLAALLLFALFVPFKASAAIQLVMCAPGVPCTPTGPANTGTGQPAWQAFGESNANDTEAYGWQLVCTPPLAGCGVVSAGVNLSLGINIPYNAAGTFNPNTIETTLQQLQALVVTLQGTALQVCISPSGSNAVFSICPNPLFTTAPTVTPTQSANAYADGLILSDPTAATSGQQRYSPDLLFKAQGFGTTAPGSQEAQFRFASVPSQGTTAPSAVLELDYQINGGGFTQVMTWGSGFNVVVPNGRLIAGGLQPSGNSTSGNVFNLPTTNTPGVAAGGVQAMQWDSQATYTLGELDTIGTAATFGTVTGGCGTPANVHNFTEAGDFTFPNAGTCSVVIQFAHSSTTGKRCNASNETDHAGAIQIGHGVQFCTIQVIVTTPGALIGWSLIRGY